MYKSFSMELAGRTLTVDVGRVAAQANGAAFMHYGDTTVLSTATASEKPREGIDFFPLSVEYEEKMYAVGKIPGGFNKREGKASENAILTSRVIDRPMRPLFPKDYRNDVTLNNMVMSVDPDCSPELTAMLGSAIATAISDIPFDGPTATTQVGLIDGEFVFNPTSAQRQVSDMALTVASTREKVIMIEAGANEVPEDKMIEAIFAAHEVNQQVIAFIDKIVAECGKEKHSYESCAIPEELFAAIREIVPPEEMEEAKRNMDKYADYRTYLSFDMQQLIQNEDETIKIGLSKMIKKNSGGEGQNPLYVALLASFAQAYKIDLKPGLQRNPTIRLVVLDEAFSKMDAEKVASCIQLIRGLGFQALISATNDKIQNYLETVDKIFVFANPNKKAISIQEFEKKEFDQLKQDISGDEDGEEV